ncbi:hypothetical protein [Desulfococcus sp.]|uniref:hypothetical protein n=1 Tax=Desulfococcus sp. TaxID=2025834 RepID=UPI003594520C
MDGLKHIFLHQKRNQDLSVFFYILFPLIASWILVSSAFSFPYQPDRQVMIDTEYTAASVSHAPGRKTWEIRTGKEKQLVTLAVYPAGADHPFCTVTIHEDGAPGTITLTERQGNQERSSENGLFILPGYPAPVNVLPVHQAETEKFYDEKRTAGGRVFVRRYRVFFEAVSRETALKNGWLTEGSGPDGAKTAAPSASALPENKGPSNPPEPLLLRMVTVEDDSKTAVVRQLWRDGDSWWIYEETPFKRSRRVE